MITSEVQRTLVKSPPELWSELSDRDSLARHLAEFGEIRITHAEPEQIVEWEAELIRGCVEIKPSGWGTKVTLTATRKLAEPNAEQASPIQAGEPTGEDPPTSGEPATTAAAEQTEPAAIDDQSTELQSVESQPDDDTHPPQTPEAAVDPPAAAEDISQEPTRRSGFFARLFGRRRRKPALEAEPQPPIELTETVPPDQPDETTAREEPAGSGQPTEASPPSASQTDPQPESASESDRASDLTSEPISTSESVPEDDPKPNDLSAELAGAEQQTEAVLTSMLDRLGAAHHRPFSRG
ncbi:MAG TPA: hypothetical protein VGF15_02080 [Solirubrobacteraceae bacterium]